MAEILKITTPLVNKNQQVQPSKQADPTIPFNLQETGKVIKPNPQSDLLKQNNGMIQKEEAPNILMNLLKDPSVSVNFLKNIFMLQEIIRLLPVNNQTMTQEIEQLFDSLMISPDDIVAELMKQENTSTKFKGELFDFLRDLETQNPQPEIRRGVANLLKAINSMTGRENALRAVSNGLRFLAESLSPSKNLAAQLRELADEFSGEDAPSRFNELKSVLFDVFDEVENSILLSPKMSKVMAITIYNLSRFNNNQDFFQDAVANLLTLIDGRQTKSAFVERIKNFLDEMRTSEQNTEGSKIMDVLAKIIGKQADDESITLLNSDKIEKIITSLLSSPCNYTPLLHFVVPVEFMDLRSFAELWIDPNAEGEERENGSKTKDNIHMLVVFDIEGIGQFEAELYVTDSQIDFSLLCPPAYADDFANVSSTFEKCIVGSPYRFRDINIGRLERPRSLMDVFKTLPYKRTGVDVKV